LINDPRSEQPDRLPDKNAVTCTARGAASSRTAARSRRVTGRSTTACTQSGRSGRA